MRIIVTVDSTEELLPDDENMSRNEQVDGLIELALEACQIDGKVETFEYLPELGKVDLAEVRANVQVIADHKILETGNLEVGHVNGEVVINHPSPLLDMDGVGHLVFSPDQARNLAHTLIAHAQEAEMEAGTAEEVEVFDGDREDGMLDDRDREDHD